MAFGDHALSQGAQGGAVAQLHQLLRELNFTIAPEELSAQTFARSTQEAVQAFQRLRGLPTTGIVDAVMLDALQREHDAERTQPKAISEPTMIAVQGRVTLADGSPMSQAAVQLMAQNLRGMRSLMGLRTDDVGNFAGKFDRQQLQGSGKLEDGLVAQALNAQGQVVAQSDPQFRLGDTAIFRLIVAAQVITPPPEYARVQVAATSALAEGMSLATLEKPQIQFIARQIGVPVRQVDALKHAQDHSARWNLPAPLLYACARQGLSAQVERLAAFDESAVRVAVKKAVAAGQIAPLADADLNAALAQLAQARVAVQLSAKPDEQSASLSDLLELAQIPSALHAVIATHAAANGLGTPNFWLALQQENQISVSQVAEARFVVQVAGVTAGYLPLLRYIVQTHQANRIRSAADLVYTDADTWERLLTTPRNGRTIGAPPGTPGQTLTEQAHTYALFISQTLAQAFPTPAFAARVSREGMPAKPHMRDNLLRFIAQNTDFDLGTVPVNRFLANHPNALAGISDAETFKDDLSRLQRVFRLAPFYDQVKVLLPAGLDSAHKITQLGKNVFLGRYGQALGDEAPKIYARAAQVAATTTQVLTQQTLHTFEENIPALQDSMVSVGARQIQEELFGSLDFCGCDECRSVLSPAAYLADLLAWLAGRAATSPSLSALDILLDRGTLTTPAMVRRPDLAGIELSCINTNTPLPYIDLVNEILEQAVVGPIPLPTPLTVPQTTQSADELSVTPEHVNEAAYTTLNTAVFPFHLPYDLHTSQAEVFLEGMKSSRAALLVATHAGTSATAYADPIVVRAELGLPQLTWNILTTADPTTITPMAVQPYALWGIASATLLDPGGSGTTIDWYVALRYVPIFLQQAGIQYADLLALLQSNFMQAANLSLNPASPCNLDDATIHNLVGPVATRANRFLRLWRVFGGTLDDLDALLTALNITEITPITLTTLAQVKRVQALLPGLSLGQLSVLWANLSTHIPEAGGLSPYDQFFQNPAQGMPVYPDFALNAARTELTAPGGTISSESFAVLAALNLAQADLPAMLAPAGPVPDVMNLANLSYLVRIVTLARALHLTISDFLAMLPLISVSPFDGTQIADTITWVQGVQKLLAANLTVSQIVWLMEGVVPVAVSKALTDAAIITQLTTLQGQLQAAPPASDTSPLVKNALWTMLNLPATYPLVLLQHIQQVGGTANLLAYLQGLGTGTTTLTDPNLVPSIRRLQQIQVVLGTCGFASGTAAPGAFTLPLSDLPCFFNYSLGPTIEPAFPAGTIVPGLGWLDPNALPASNAPVPANPASLVALQRLLAGTQFCIGEQCTLQQLFGLFVLVTTGGTKAAAQTMLAGFTHWKLADLQALGGTTTDGPLALPYPAAYQDERGLLRLKACFDLVQKMNITAAQLLTWAVEPVPAAVAQDIRAALRAGFGSEQAWLTAARPWQDTLRQQQRDALVGYLCGQRQSADLKAAVDATTLYDTYLIDVNMEACMMTSRIKQAISSTQLFIQRAFMNMEPLVQFSDDDHQQWLWMRNYRVWEANRQVFLYPENWVQPELRDNKSSLFRDLENALLQSKLTTDSAEAALADYLNGLYQISRLEIMGYYHQLETGASGQQINVLHVIGRTSGTPPTYYYRRFVDGAYWTAWEKVTFTIKSDHVVPIVYNRKLRLCWVTIKPVKDPTITSQQIQNAQNAASSSGPFTSNPDGTPPMQWQMTLNWSEYHQGKWSSPMKADDPSQQLNVNQPSPLDSFLGRTNTVPDEADFFFQGFTETSSGDLVIRCFSYSDQDVPDGGGIVHDATQQGDFHFAACQGTVSVVLPNAIDNQQYYPPVGSSDRNQTFDLSYAGGLASDHPMVSILSATPQPNAAIAYGHQFLTDPLPAPFFWQDHLRSLFAQPVYAGPIRYRPGRPRWPTGPVPLPQPEPDNGGAYTDGSYPTDVINALTQDAQQAHLNTTLTPAYRYWTQYQYLFDMAYHPWVCTFIEELERGGVEALYRRWVQVAPYILNPSDDHLTFFHDDYHPSATNVATPYPVADVDFRYGGVYSLYNWELFYHIPLLIAKRLTDDQQFEDAMAWLARVFDPNDRTLLPAPHRFWRTRPFFEAGAATSIQGLLNLLDSSTAADAAKKADLMNQIAQWRNSPFNPHLLARLRPSAYQKTAIMQYLDALIGWGDQLFHQNTIESINEAAQMYIAALGILGPRPQLIPEAQPEADQTFTQIRSALDTFSNALVTLENYVPQTDTPSVSIYGGSPPPPTPILYFCIPPNAKLLGYWDTIADRLFKIRNCQNIAGAAQQLPLFEPPIDPALLVAATAAGISIADVLNEITSSSTLIYRFEVMIRRAHEMTSALSALGAKMLSALEHQDAKNLELLRSSQGLALMQRVADVMQSEIDEAQQKIDALTASQQIQNDRASYYDTLTVIMFMFDAAVDFTKGLVIGAKATETGAHAAGTIAHALPNASAGTVAIAPTANVEDGGTHVGHTGDQGGKTAGSVADLADKILTYMKDVSKDLLQLADWQQKAGEARATAEKIGKDIIVAQTALLIAQKKLDNFNLQMDQAQAIDDFYHNEFTSADLYGWMVGQLAALYFQSYQVAYGVAQQAERTFRLELGLYPLETPQYVTFGYWDSLQKGLLAGERMELDLRRMEAAYYLQNTRTYEITKKVSLKHSAPAALATLLAGGSCFISLGEDLYDADYNWHYMRRIKVVNLGITFKTTYDPSAPFPSTITCTLTLAQDKIRTQSGRVGDPDVIHNTAQSTVASTALTSYLPSNTSTYAGMFTIDFLKDERFFPFEGSGAISEWHILMPMLSSFAATIDDIWLQIKYTALGEPPIGSDPLVVLTP